MPVTKIGEDLFRSEAQRRLIDTWELMHILGVRSRSAIWKRVQSGTLPEPVIKKDRAIALWDRDAVETAL